MLGGQPSPRGFLSRVIGHAKVLPVYLMEQCWHQLLHSDNFLQVTLDQSTQLLLLCPPIGFSTGYPPPIGPMMMSLDFLLRPHLLWVSHPIRAVPAHMPFNACAMQAGWITSSFIPHSASEG